MNIKILLSLFLSISFVYAQDMQKEDREISVRKVLDTFGKVEQKEVSAVDKLKKMFTEGKVSGQIRTVYAGYAHKEKSATDSYATAIGGMLKYELASLHGFNAGVAFTNSQDISLLTGAKGSYKHSNELSSSKGHYAELTEAYINYTNAGFNLRFGRQMMDTPLADGDDTRMIPNTFEAYMLNYKMNSFEFTLGNVQRWQGAGTGLGFDENDKMLESNWIKTGDRGTSMAGVAYSDAFEFNLWYYDISKEKEASKASYFDIGNHTSTGDIRVHASLQYLHETQSQKSGIKADIYGALVEFVVHDISFNIAYNKAKKYQGKRSFSGIGGGSLYTSMDTMILDEITEDRGAEAFVLGVEYDQNNWSFLYAYGNFEGDKNSNGIKAHIVEHDLGFEYNFNDEFVIAGIYVKQSDKMNSVKTSNDWDRTQIMMKYDF